MPHGAAAGGGHSTQKPIEAMARPMRNHKVDSVYDPFLGTGTTLIAAEKEGRRCFGLEIDPAYCDVIVRRWETMTGSKASRSAK
jgi:DNA modification methylase